MNLHHHGGPLQVFPQVTGLHCPKKDDIDVLEMDVDSMGPPLRSVNWSLKELVLAVHRDAQPLGENEVTKDH